MLESARKKTAPRKVDLYEVFCAVLYLLRTGCQWRALPSDFPKWRTVHSYWAIWSEPREGGSLLEQALKKSGWRGPRETGAQRLQHALDRGRTERQDQPFAQGVREILGEHVQIQIAKLSELHTFKVMPKR